MGAKVDKPTVTCNVVDITYQKNLKEDNRVNAFLSFLTIAGKGLLINPVEIDGRQKPAVEVALWQQLLEAHAVEHFWCKCFSSLHDSHLRIAFALFNYFY
jgi:hypothetical protein